MTMAGHRMDPDKEAKSFPGVSIAGTSRAKLDWRNEDSVLVLTGTRGIAAVAAVADGATMPGGGKIASRAAISAVEEWAYGLEPGVAGRLGLSRLLEDAFRRAQEGVARAASEEGPPDMATTLVVGLVTSSAFAVGHLGNSRAYLVRPDSIERLTRDHDRLAEALSRDPALAARIRSGDTAPPSGLTRHLGARQAALPDVSLGHSGSPHPNVAGTWLVLVTDGVTGSEVWPHLTDREIARVVRNERSHHAAAQALVALGLEKGDGDDASAVVVEFG